MFKSLSKLLLMITLLVAFVGQSVAYHFIAFDDVDASLQSLEDRSTLHTKTSPQTENNSQQTPQQNNSIDGASALALEDVDGCCDIDCCEGQCYCPANACTSLVYVDNTLALSRLILSSESVLSFVQTSPQFFVTSLYRPPIFTS